MEVSKPRRVSHSYEQTLEAPPETVFPLLCPVREVEWVAGWEPLAVFAESGVAEEGCTFVTSADGDESVWIVTMHDPEAYRLQIWKVTPHVTVCRLDIQLEALAAGRTKAAITYCHTSLGPRGDDLVADFTREFYEGFMRRWETAMNHYLRTGQKLEA